jgi:hypothetical protein
MVEGIEGLRARGLGDERFTGQRVSGIRSLGKMRGLGANQGYNGAE